MTDIERVWARIKDTAADMSRSDLFPSAGEARRSVLRIFTEERAGIPPAEAVEFFASEMIQLVAQKAASALPT